MDAANIDLKGFTDQFYVKLTGAHLQPVLDTLEYVHHDTNCWLEITTLLIPGHNDSDAELGALSKWVMQELGPDVPLHFSAFHPDWKMADVSPTPPATLTRARNIALDAGLNHVYTGNVHDTEGDTTYCATCHTPLIVRDWYQINAYHLTPNGSCPKCGTKLSGHFGKFEHQFGRTPQAVQIARKRI
jgi:pyruvate formate lyase activating enzyme